MSLLHLYFQKKFLLRRKILGGHLIFFLSKKNAHCLLVCIVSYKKSAKILIFFSSLYSMSFFIRKFLRFSLYPWFWAIWLWSVFFHVLFFMFFCFMDLQVSNIPHIQPSLNTPNDFKFLPSPFENSYYTYTRLLEVALQLTNFLLIFL